MMPKVRFIQPWVVKQGDGLGPVYKVGDVVDLPRSYADKYKGRGLAVDAEETAPASAAPAHPLDHDGDGKAGGSLPANPGPATLTAAGLLAALDTDPAMKQFLTFRAEAEKILGKDMPSKKADIIEALKARAGADAGGEAPSEPAAPGATEALAE